MINTVLVTYSDTIFGETLAAVFTREGFQVFALGSKPIENVTLLPLDLAAAAAALKEKTGKLDFLLDTTDVRSQKDNFTVREGIDTAVVEQVYRQNILSSMALLEAFLPLLDQGEGKRLFYLTSADASVNETRRVDHFAYNMSKAALHQFIQMTRNKLAPKGYTFRVFDPMDRELSPEAAAESAYNYITRRRGTENHDPLRDDEDNLVFRDAQGRQHSW
jgi:NAD(P)-dependent dehydrogenase (short-subunit alcohol dehydrogenase family)